MKNTIIKLPTEWGELSVQAKEAGVVVYKKPWEDVPFLRVHSACMFSESLGSVDCDCRLQLDAALKHVGQFGGAVVYLPQEGRGLGLTGKIKAIALQQEYSIDTASAYTQLGHRPDLRSYEDVLGLLDLVDFPKKIKLATNNPAKISALSGLGFSVERIKLDFPISPEVAKYLDEKQQHLGHHG